MDACDEAGRPSNLVCVVSQLRSGNQLLRSTLAATGPERATSEIHQGMRVVAVGSYAFARRSRLRFGAGAGD